MHVIANYVLLVLQLPLLLSDRFRLREVCRVVELAHAHRTMCSDWPSLLQDTDYTANGSISKLNVLPASGRS